MTATHPLRPDITAGDEYHTPEKGQRAMIDRLVFNSRLYFIGNFIKNIFKARRIVRKGLYTNLEWINSSQDIFTAVERTGTRVHITGLDHIRNNKGPVLFLSNHMSTLETMIFPGIIQPLKEVTFIVKDELLRNWAFRDVMCWRDPIVMSRSNPREDFRIAMEQGVERLGRNISVVVFPQSTRSLDFRPSEFNSIGIKLAARSGVPVIPVAIKTDFWRSGKYLRDLGPIDRSKNVHIAFGEPMPVREPGKDEHQKVISYIQDHLDSWRRDHV
jgi:1-acyl-sn-glycerol-3-phosphate acyltransferase